MTKEEEFILLIVTNTYLTHEFEYSLQISVTDVSYLANSCLFESNILRFRALASLKLYEHVTYTNYTEQKQKFEYLTKAIESL